MQWLKDRSKGRRLEISAPDSTTSARAYFRKQVLDWNPPGGNGIESVPSFGASGMCEAESKDAEPPHDEFVRIRYGASTFPFDFPFDRPLPNGDKRTVIDAGPDVKLVHRPDSQFNVATEYQVYVRCAVPGAPKGHLNEVPLEGSLRDTFTGDPSHRTHLQHLLHSAKVMAAGFGCTNKPQIPSAVPASVKD
ncbi:hypothetical protein ACFQ7F_22815 [Streptomyces sp. NPDC056486]|uniref:hypothetical protein n=1 Tax=Streptomyces sp. NPDC056486 TaxID=3345835 RepID=UPI0036A118FB